MDDLISRQTAIEALRDAENHAFNSYYQGLIKAHKIIADLPPAQPDLGEYEYHYDHTDCIWYRPEARNRCPATCAQYRDGWNDAMNYIFRDGEGYRPFRRDKKYEG